MDKLGILHKRVRSLDDVGDLTGLIIPGGESTTMDLFMQKYGLKDWLIKRVRDETSVIGGQFKVFGTCAGLILLARYGLLNATVARNAYGRQLASFTAEISVEKFVNEFSVKGHFIRAPKIISVGAKVEVLAVYEGLPVLIREGNVFGATFHPELAGDSGLHEAIFSG
ncbi:MAG: pyridoxal 5'-phosphate synthase glutaminase subunit PdxT [Candidatus Gracilibacteria bacterium]